MSEPLPSADAPGAPPAGGASARSRPRPGASRAEAGLRALFAERLAGRRAVLLLSAGEAESSGRAAQAAVELASAAARVGRTPVLADLGFQRPSLHQALGLLDGGGVTDAVFDGLSISEAARPVQGRGLRFLPTGAPVADLDELLASFGTGPLLHGDPDPDLLLFLYVPAGAPGLRELAREVGSALVFAGPDAPRESWGLPDECRVFAVLAPAAAPRRRPPPSEAPPPSEVPPATAEAPPVAAEAPPREAAAPAGIASPPAEGEAPVAEVAAPADIAPPFADASASAEEDGSRDEVAATAEPPAGLVASDDPFAAVDARTEAAEPGVPAVAAADVDRADAEIADADPRDSDRSDLERPEAHRSDAALADADRSDPVLADSDRFARDRTDAVLEDAREDDAPTSVAVVPGPTDGTEAAADEPRTDAQDVGPGILAEVATLAQVPDRDLRDGSAADIVAVEVEELVPEFDAADADPAVAQAPEEESGRPGRRGRRGRQDEGGALAR
ncbi:MAG: hypothetical protein KY444_01425, partial [Gemmatimonadetes bacterium]|nr:hypothetical protein [Gemmatimonadota bacterium]